MSAPVAETEQSHETTATLTLELEPPGIDAKSRKSAQYGGEYKKHSLAARYWGDISLSQASVRPVAAAEAQATFLRGLLDMPTDHRERHPIDWLISLAVHVALVSTVLIAPLAFTQALDLRNLQLTYLAVPRPPAAPPPPRTALEQVTRRATRPLQTVAVTAPALIPPRIAQVKDEPAPDVNPEGVVGGIPGGEAGGVLGGILSGSEHVSLPTPAAPTKKTVYRVGGVVRPPRQIKVVPPIYSPIAIASHTEGVVEVDAIIDELGDVVEARAVSGPGLLIPAALRAVVQWKYEPTYLDGMPVPIRMNVQVHFRLH